MNALPSTFVDPVAEPPLSSGSESLPDVETIVTHHAHLLPSQGPISVFVHHNTLHAFEEQSFHEAVTAAADLYDCHPYLPEEEYRTAVRQGRISVADLQSELLALLGDEGDRLVGHLGTRHDLRMSMLAHPLREGSVAEIEWFIGEAEALYHYREGATEAATNLAIGLTRRWLVRDFFNGQAADCPLRKETEATVAQFGGHSAVQAWEDSTWEAFSLHLLWQACCYGCQSYLSIPAKAQKSFQQDDSDEAINALLIRFASAFLDQGQASLTLPKRRLGFFRSFLRLYRGIRSAEPWLAGLAARIVKIEQSRQGPIEVIEKSLAELGIPKADWSAFLQDELLKLRGWAGLLWQMETNAEWTRWPAPSGTLVGYMAIRLLLKVIANESGGMHNEIAPNTNNAPSANLAFILFQIAQIRGWSGVDLMRLTSEEWSALLGEIRAFPNRERRRVFHLAYERHYRDQALGAIRQSATSSRPSTKPPAYQVVCCIDDREESLRRHWEEIDPECETFGFAGFFGVAMYYRGTGEAQFKPLCPVNVKPDHYIVEEPVFSEEEASRRRASARKAIGQATHRVLWGSRSAVGGLVTGVLGTLAAVPLVLRVVFPRTAETILRRAGGLVTDKRTQLALDQDAQLQANETESGSATEAHRRYTVDEMAKIVAGVLRSTGLANRLASVVVICGHGSSSLNNPHAAAYDCGACGGGRGGPNARAFAQMANDLRVRKAVASLGVTIPESTIFVGAYHNTCDDSIAYYDLDKVSKRHADLLHRIRAAGNEARARDAHERSRRFLSADLQATARQALRHVERRSVDLSQVRSECGHAPNALCLVGRREWSRGLFLDRRAFLTSYDPALDDESHSLLAGLLAAVIPVCGGINLEYYFSRIDNVGYGCGTKLPHNVVSLLGVMDGAGSDLRTGLPWQMVEIHEPMRILFVIEATPKTLLAIMAGNPTIDRLVRNDWVQLATLDPLTGETHFFRDGEFQRQALASEKLPITAASADWYRGQRDHLGFAQINAEGVL